LEAFPAMSLTSIEDGIRTSLKAFKAMADAGELEAAYNPGG